MIDDLINSTLSDLQNVENSNPPAPQSAAPQLVEGQASSQSEKPAEGSWRDMLNSLPEGDGSDEKFLESLTKELDDAILDGLIEDVRNLASGNFQEFMDGDFDADETEFLKSILQGNIADDEILKKCAELIKNPRLD